MANREMINNTIIIATLTGVTFSAICQLCLPNQTIIAQQRKINKWYLEYMIDPNNKEP